MCWPLLIVSIAELPLGGYEKHRNVVKVYFKGNTASLPSKPKPQNPAKKHYFTIYSFLCTGISVLICQLKLKEWRLLKGGFQNDLFVLHSVQF